MKLGPIDIQWRNARLAESQVNVPMERTAASAESLPVGLPGTPIFHGFLEDFGEYNPQLEGLTAIRTYEKMRRSDAQGAATPLGPSLINTLRSRPKERGCGLWGAVSLKQKKRHATDSQRA